MKKRILFVSIAILSVTFIYRYNSQETPIEKLRKQHAAFLKNHPYNNRVLMTKEDLKKIPKKDRPDLAFEQDFLRTINPVTRKLDREALLNGIKVSNEKKSQERTSFNWESRGPKKVAGRTRAFMFDPNDETNKKVFAGGVGGGIWMNRDITNEDSSWQQVYPEMSNFAISSMDYDPVNSTTFYVGTGEGWGNIDAINGGGIWKSIDGGSTWSHLSSTSNITYIFDLVVRDEGSNTGVIYASFSNSGLYKSSDGGINWVLVLNEASRDIEISTDNTLWVGNNSGEIFKSTNGVNWDKVYTSSLSGSGRVELATAPSNENKVYALIEANNAIGEIIRSSDAGQNWASLGTGPNDFGDTSIPSDDFTRSQAWYDLIVAVNPSDDNEVYVGGVNSFKSSDGGTSWVKISSWESGYDNSVSYAHADHHNIIFRPENNAMVLATDGGIFYAPNLSDIPTSGANAYTTGIFPRNLNYNVTQFYSGAIDPINSNIFIGGTQDNGTLGFSDEGLSDTYEVTGGDGGFCFIDQTATNSTQGYYYITSYTRNNYVLTNTNTNSRVSIISDSDTGDFINIADYDDVNNILYTYKSTSAIYKIRLKADGEDQGFGGSFTGTIESPVIRDLRLKKVSHIRVSPYNENNRAVFLGTQDGSIVKVVEDGTSSIITNSGVAGTVSSIEIGTSEEELLVTYSNYGVKSVWYTSDGGSTWEDKEGDLPDMPVRWSLFNPLNRKEVILATELGVWKTSDIYASSVTWEPASSNMGNVRVDMLQYRESDNLILAATHGRGMFTSTFTAATASIDEVVTGTKDFTIYPTISNGNFTLFGKNTLGNSQVTIFDINGRQVYQKNIDFTMAERNNVSVNLSSGIYMVNLVDAQRKKTSSKIIIE